MTEPDHIPPSDLYADLPLYGRYSPKPDDFYVDIQHVISQSTDSLNYWASGLDLCNKSVRIYPGDEGRVDRGVLSLLSEPEATILCRGKLVWMM